jgi:hypothetical protein
MVLVVVAATVDKKACLSVEHWVASMAVEKVVKKVF